MRSAPCCWITGSATPSSLTRLCSVVMFCLSAVSSTSRSVCGSSAITSFSSVPSAASVATRLGMASAIAVLARVRVSSSRETDLDRAAGAEMPAWRRFFSRSSERRSPAELSSRL